MQNYVGQQIDRYRITERLGMGGMAVVYKAYDTRLERDVALKLIRTESIPQDQHKRLFKRFEREAKAQARFKHPHIVAVHDYGEVDNSPYLVMDFISGGTLKEHLHGPVDWRQAVRWLIPVAEALAYAHKEGIIHRDVKPANILFDKESQPILTDFGIAKVLETDEATLTGTGLGVGTPEYMAPEQWQGQTSPATDQYALSVVFYELITGRKPYSADTPAAIILMQATEPLAPPSGLVQGIPDTVEKVLYKALSCNPEDRYESMETFAKALRGLLANAETVKPVRPKQTAQPVEPAPEVAAATNSESVTRDALDATPAGGIPQPTGSSKVEKKGLPKWAGWAFGGIIGLALVTLAFNLGSKSANTPKAENTQVVSAVTETEEPTTVPTETTSPIMTATITLTPEPTVGIGSTMINDIDQAAIVEIPSGNFQMGENKVDIYLDSYWIYRNEVTNLQFLQFLQIMGNQTEVDTPWYDPYYTSLFYEDQTWKIAEGYDEYPIIGVTWYGAQAYCQWAAYSLPTEAQWEKAARGYYGNIYPWGNSEEPTSTDSCLEIKPIGTYPHDISVFGVMDMACNASEWVYDWYASNSLDWISKTNPTGPATGVYKVVRGADVFSHGDVGYYSNLIERHSATSIRRLSTLGFRCILYNGPSN